MWPAEWTFDREQSVTGSRACIWDSTGCDVQRHCYSTLKTSTFAAIHNRPILSKTMLSNNPHQSSLRPLGGHHIFERLQKEIERKVKLSSSGLPEIKTLPPRQAQEFLNYLGCRLRTAAKKFHTTEFVSEIARSAFEEKINTEFVRRHCYISGSC